MKAAKARELTDEELVKKERDIREELFKFRFQHATGQLENPIRLRTLRRDMARVITIRKEKAAAARKEAQKAAERAG